MNSKLANNNQDCIPINFCVRTIPYVHLFPEDVCLCQLKKKTFNRNRVDRKPRKKSTANVGSQCILE